MEHCSKTLPGGRFSARNTNRNGVTKSLMPCTYPLAGLRRAQVKSIRSSDFSSMRKGAVLLLGGTYCLYERLLEEFGVWACP